MKVLLKILKKNVRNSIVCFMSTILTVIILFVFLGVKELVLGTMSMEERVRSQLGIAIQTYMYILLFIGLILISYTVSNYSRIRIKDYGMFMVFGEEKKDIIRMIILEYGIICGISWLIGCVVGTPFVILLQSIFRKEGIQTVQDPCWFLKNIGRTCFYMCVILCIAVIMNIIKIQNNSLASLLNTEQKRGTVPSVKASVIGAIAGLICFVFAIILFSKVPMTYPRMKYGVLFSLTGLYLWFTYLGNVILRWVKKKEKWYDRVLVFRADSLPADALTDAAQVTAESLGLADGCYTVEVSMEGGSGRVSVESPAKLVVKDQKAVAEVVWSSPNYDYMKVGEEKFLPVNQGGETSVFEIPVTVFDRKMAVAADTTAMSTPHEIEYTLLFDSASIKTE